VFSFEKVLGIIGFGGKQGQKSLSPDEKNIYNDPVS
jgi:hypothetical protein